MAASLVSRVFFCLRIPRCRNPAAPLPPLFKLFSPSQPPPPPICKQYSDSTDQKTPGKPASTESTLSKFVKAVELWEEKAEDVEVEEESKEEVSFASLLRNSKLFQLGDPSGRVVLGKIIEVQDNDLYIDFGGKFHCVCKTPQIRSHEYRRGVHVKLLLHDLEMSAAFLGSVKHVTLLEADATLIGLRRN
ncbi:28S ribosomal protein S28, mitochondrial-like [Argonauta hians]